MRIDFWHKWELNDGKLMGALLGATLLGIGATIGSFVIAPAFEPPWFEAHVEVPGHTLGEDPFVEYTRTIRRNMQGQWSVEVLRNDGEAGWTEVCQGSGIAPYALSEAGRIDMHLSVYAGIDPAECLSEPGLYRLITSWKMLSPDSNEPRLFWDESNVFEVSPN